MRYSGTLNVNKITFHGAVRGASYLAIVFQKLLFVSIWFVPLQVTVYQQEAVLSKILHGDRK